jgi:hypothetical protein
MADERRQSAIDSSTHPMRPQDPAVPLPHENIAAVHESVADAHVAQSLFGVLQFLQQFEIAGRDDRFAGGESLHG